MRCMKVCKYNSGYAIAQEPPVQLINIIYCGGWIARLHDLRIMHQFCDYLLSYDLHKLLLTNKGMGINYSDRYLKISAKNGNKM